MVPLPVPLDAPVKVTHEAAATAFQAHPVWLAMLTEPLPPAAGKVEVVGLIV